MGYSEIACQICGMSFNIGRLRTPTEPRSAAWNYTGYGNGGFPRRHSVSSSRACSPSAGCKVVVRNPVQAPDLTIKVDEDGEEDGDYMHRSSEEISDPYEYDSDYESEPKTAMDEDDDAMSCSSEASDVYRAFIQSLAPPAAQPEVMLPERDAPEDDTIEYEHIAGGLDCKWSEHTYCDGAFNGHAISAEDMFGCTTLQCLVPKDNDGEWESESDDEEFEKSGRFFLSGLCDTSPSRDMNWPTVFPSRHDCSSPKADNIFYITEEAEEYSMPFHPTCLEVFKRASMLRNGAVDYEGLINWWIIEGGDGYYSFPRDPAVNHDQWFEHVAGNEFLVANPCIGAKWGSILAASDRTGDPDFGYDTPVFGEVDCASHDLFAQLPRELRFMVLEELESRDIANLRLASRSFHQLPQALFRKLTLRELPWVWEAWCSLGYSKWVYTRAAELRRRDEQRVERGQPIWQAIDVLEEDARSHGDDGLHQAAIAALTQAADKEENEPGPLPSTASLPAPEKTDWYRLRCELARNMPRLLGLRNRRRIWKDCEEILDRIARYRDAGTMILGETVNAREVAEAAVERTIEANRRWHNYCQAGRPGTYNFDDWA
ncbi:hypothetical protein PFICI_14220 [Pestalotiopsis fici W106-1]|uniref:F-box domain-containing protein n=1 Tax=Pestalotiopsis fici (strain W106-1 / CGMCC3.15140) TaxID=1229662 RepID=W3WKU1_PESFW|nr:uncharacterized protein PFICI_14220 [Pestalotiopsis fici W106-1]ETS74354.1 hypothetical protein PFICI_14220 [Pestalotiopsis fici W106-1]